MNIFVLDLNSSLAAQMACDKHVVKMILETAQLLCSYYPQGIAPYKRTHYNHPCAKWTRSSLSNYKWLVQYGIELCKEYTFRYNKIHKSQRVIEWCNNNIDGLADHGITPFAQAMPDVFKVPNDPVSAYRNYYIAAKKHILKYTIRQPPAWISIEPMEI